MAALIPTTRHALEVAGVVFTDVPGLIVLGGYVDTNQYATGRKFDTNAGYQITAGKTYRALALKMETEIQTLVTCTVGYGDNDVGQDSGTNPTNAKNAIGAGMGIIQVLGATVRERALERSFKFDMLAAKYPFFNTNSTNMSLNLYGYEV